MIDRAAVQAALDRMDRSAMTAQRWFGAKGRTIERLELDEAFELDVRADAAPEGLDLAAPERLDHAAPHVLAIATLTLDDRTHQRYQFALTGRPLQEAVPGDGTWRMLAVAMAEGRTIPAVPVDADGTIRAALVCRPAAAMPPDGPGTERDLGADQSNTSVVLGDTLLLKAYRRIQPGLNPDLEMTAFLSEQAGFGAVPPLGGFVELVEARHGTATLAMAQQFVAGGTDAFESIAASLMAWLLAPGEVSLEFATEVAVDLGALTAGLHAAVASGHGMPEMEPREASGDELRSWAASAHDHLERALDLAPAGTDAAAVLRDLAPRVLEALTVLDALPTAPQVIRAHGDLHLGQVLIAPDGFRIVDFEGEPLSTPDERRAHRHPLRDVASMLRSIDHVGRSAGRRAERANDGPLAEPGLDLDGWLHRARQRFLDAYRSGLREARVPVDLDPALLLAFEVDKELYEFAYAAAYLPSWLWAPTEGMRGLFAADDIGGGGGGGGARRGSGGAG